MASMPWTCDSSIVASMVDGYYSHGALFTGAMQTFLAAQCALVTPEQWPKDRTAEVLEDPYFDFIVIGAGSAGAVVANRLSEVPDWKVLLVEAGGDPTLGTEIPMTFFGNINTPIDWGYRPERQDNACLSYVDQRCAWPRGKVLGGCSSTNGMFYVRGNSRDYDEWEKEGNQGWSYKEVLPYFKKSQALKAGISYNFNVDKYHGKDGYLHTERNGDNEFENIIITANSEAGLKVLDDINGDDQMGVTRAFSTTKDGRRMSTARAFLSPIKDRTNLYVMKDTLATKLVFEENSNKVIGILLHKNGKEFTIHAKKEVVISAGTINTSQLLLLSGLGPKGDLTKLGIEVKKNLAVGSNLQDHVYVPLYISMPADEISNENYTKFFIDYIIHRNGPLSSVAPSRIIDFINTKDSTSKIPNIQHHYIVFAPNMTDSLNFHRRHGFNDEVIALFREANKDKLMIQVSTVLLRPKSKGVIKLRSSNPHDYPLIYANGFADNDDLITVIEGIKHAFKLENTEIFKKYGLKLEWLNITPCKELERNSDEFLQCWAKEMTIYLYHPVGTAKMGPASDPEAVIDADLKVHGIEGLRVVDASIMPHIVRGNTNAPVIMIGEKGADLIKSSWLNDKDEL